MMTLEEDRTAYKRIKTLLKFYHKGLIITEIARKLSLNRNSVAKYLEILLITGQVEVRVIGMAKVYTLSQRVPLSAMLGFSSDLILVLDEDERIVQVNDRLLATFGKGREELLGEPIGELDLPPFQNLGTRALIEEIDQMGEVSREVRFLQGQAEMHLRIKGVSTVFDDGCRGVTLIMEDVTSQRAAERELLIKENAIASSINGIIIMDLSGVITYVNHALLTMMGYAGEEELCGHPIEEVIQSRNGEAVRKLLTDAISRRKGGVWETALVRRDRSLCDLQISLSTVTDQAGVPVCMMLSLVDTTERNRTLQDLTIKEKVIEGSINGIAIFDPDGRLVYANPAMREIIGIHDDLELIGRQVEWFAWDDAEIRETITRIRKELHQKGRWFGEVDLKRMDRSSICAQLTLSLIRDEQGNHLCSMASFVDITTQKRTEEALRITYENLRDTIEFIPDPTFIVDLSGVVMAWNQAMEGLTGVRKGEILGTRNYSRALSFLQGLRPILIDLIDLPTEDLISQHPGIRRFGDSIFVEAHVPSLNGGKGGCLWGKASPLLDHEGKRIGAIESFRDISAWKQAEEMIRGGEEDRGER